MYQPLKRFTQCGSLTMLFAVFIVLFGVSSTALTTFGKSNSQNTATPPPSKDHNYLPLHAASLHRPSRPFPSWSVGLTNILFIFIFTPTLHSLFYLKKNLHLKSFHTYSSPLSLSSWTCALTLSVIAKDCVSQVDCQAMAGTSCVRDYPSQQSRCLCGDNSPPINGKCTAKFKGLWV